MVVVLRLSKDTFKARRPKTSIFLGYLQAVLLVLLTFLFGSIWAGTLFFTLVFVASFTTTIAFSRLLSVWLCSWMEGVLSMTIIKCKDDNELEEIATVLAAMPGVLIENKTNGYKYSAGYMLGAKCQSYNLSAVGEVIQEAKARAFGFAIGAVAGGIIGVLVAIPVYIASIPAVQPFLPPISISSKESFLPLIIAGISCFLLGIIFFLRTRRELTALSGYKVETRVATKRID